MRVGRVAWTLQCGAGLVEYGLLVMLVSIFVLGVVFVFGDNLRGVFSTADNSLAGHDSTPNTRLVELPTGSPLGRHASALSGDSNQAPGPASSTPGISDSVPVPSRPLGPNPELLSQAAQSGSPHPAQAGHQAPGVMSRVNGWLLSGIGHALEFMVPAAHADELPAADAVAVATVDVQAVKTTLMTRVGEDLVKGTMPLVSVYQTVGQLRQELIQAGAASLQPSGNGERGMHLHIQITPAEIERALAVRPEVRQRLKELGVPMSQLFERMVVDVNLIETREKRGLIGFREKVNIYKMNGAVTLTRPVDQVIDLDGAPLKVPRNMTAYFHYGDDADAKDNGYESLKKLGEEGALYVHLAPKPVYDGSFEIESVKIFPTPQRDYAYFTGGTHGLSMQINTNYGWTTRDF